MAKKQKVDQDEDPAYKPYQRDDGKKKKKKQYAKLNSFSWSPAEQYLYVDFLQNHKELFASIEERKKSKVFVKMTLYIKKRGPDQCRSHHQKMSIKYGSIDQIIQRITEEKILNAKLLQFQQASMQFQSHNSQFCSEKIISIQDRPLSKPSENLTQSTTVNPFEEERQLWAYMDMGAWINQ